MLVAYLSILRHQEGEPALWAIAALVLGAVGAGYGISQERTSPARGTGGHRPRTPGLGGLAILTIGLPILVAGGLCLVAAVRE